MSRNISGPVGDLEISQDSGCFLDTFRGPAQTPVQNIVFPSYPYLYLKFIGWPLRFNNAIVCYIQKNKNIASFSFFSTFFLPQCVMACCKNGKRRSPRRGVGWEGEAGCFLGTKLARILRFTWHLWLTLTKYCFSVVAVCWDGVRLCLLLWKQSGLLEVWGGSQYWVQQRLLRGSNSALWWRWPDHPLWQWVCLVPVTVEDTGTLELGEQVCPLLLSMYLLFYSLGNIC